jgi:hypothetical protein
MSSYDIRGMQASGMTTQQINDFIKQTEANLRAKDVRSQFNPKNVGTSSVKTSVKQPVRQPIKPPTMSPVKPAAKPYVYSARPSLFPHIDGMKKKGGEVKKYAKGGKINLDACGVSTAQKSKSSPKW